MSLRTGCYRWHYYLHWNHSSDAVMTFCGFWSFWGFCRFLFSVVVSRVLEIYAFSFKLLYMLSWVWSLGVSLLCLDRDTCVIVVFIFGLGFVEFCLFWGFYLFNYLLFGSFRGFLCLFWGFVVLVWFGLCIVFCFVVLWFYGAFWSFARIV